MALQFFKPEEAEEMLQFVTAKLKQKGEAARTRGRDEAGRPLPTGQAGTLAGTAGSVRTAINVAVRTSVTNTLLGFLPEEARESIRLASLLGGIVPVVGTATGAVLGPILVQAKRKIQRDERSRAALIQAVGIAGAGKDVVTEDFDLTKNIAEGLQQFDDLKSALLSADVDRTLAVLTKLGTKGRAAAAASRAYIDNIADAQGHTRAQTEAEAAFNRAQGPYVPRRLHELYSDLNNRQSAEFIRFYKDPPGKG